MTVSEMIEAARNSTLSEEERLEILKEVVEEAERRFEEHEKRRRDVDLNFRYTI